jgi:beta-lactamase regulating signal transducer with metallopeptidase domain
LSYAALGVLVALGAFSLLSALGSAAAAAAWVGVRRRRHDPQRRAALLFAVRLLPTAVSATLVLALVVPAYGRFEPREAVESFGAGLALAGLAAMLLIARSAVRLARACRATARLEADWRRQAERIELAGTGLPAHRIRHRFPVVSVMGFFQPRLFLARQVLEGLTPAELQAVLRHETAHVTARDNLKGLLMRSCPDWLSLTSLARRIDGDWSEAAEAAADDAARGTTPGPALDLAAALLKVARMAPAGSRLVASASALHDGASVATRVERLIATEAGAHRRPAGDPLPWMAALAILAVAVSSRNVAVLQAVHRLSETIVHFLG